MINLLERASKIAQWVKELAAKFDNLSSNPKTHKEEGKDWFLQTVIWSPYMYITHTCTHIQRKPRGTVFHTALRMTHCDYHTKAQHQIWTSDMHQLQSNCMCQEIGTKRQNDFHNCKGRVINWLLFQRTANCLKRSHRNSWRHGEVKQDSHQALIKGEKQGHKEVSPPSCRNG